MKKVLIISILLMSYTLIQAKELSNKKASDILINNLSKSLDGSSWVYKISPFMKDYDITINNVSIIKRGKFNKEQEYWPVRARTKGSGITLFLGKRSRNNFDIIVDARLKTNDFDEWEVDIIKILKTPSNLIEEDKKRALKEKQKSDPLYKYCNHEAGWYNYKATSNLSIRNKPSIKGKKVGKLTKGKIIKGSCSEYEKLKNDVSGYWVSINTDQFVFGHYLTPVDTKHIPIPVKFLGDWDIEACSKGMSDSKITIKPYSLLIWEGGGNVNKLNIITDNSIELDLSMYQDGDEWSSKAHMNLDNYSLNIKYDGSTETTTYVKCK